MWTDSHAHLSDIADQRLTALLAEARAEGVGRVLNVATSLSSSETALRQRRRHPGLLAAVGISPPDAGDAPVDWFGRLCVLAKDAAVAAIGETGMDTANASYPPLAIQRAFFEKHCELAAALHRPLIVHSRGCERQVLDLCSASKAQSVIFHCYTGPLDTLKDILDAGYSVSFSGIITFKNSALSPLVAYTPLSSMLIETDSPYLAPVPHRGQENRPAWVALVGKAVARIKKIDENECAESIEAAFSRLFGAPQ